MRRPRNLSPDERLLWTRFSRGVTPLAPNKHAPLKKAELDEMEKAFGLKPARLTKKMPPPHATKPGHAHGHMPVHPHHPPHHQAVNGTVARKLRRGRAEIDGRIDLHGMRQAEAHAALNNFILRSRDNGSRCVLVITGKGSKAQKNGMDHSNPYETPGPGVLRTRLKQWVAQEPLVRICYGVEQAHPKHGGSGAFYVFIRKSG